jgi:predicted nucleic acid-binding protein
MVILDTNIIIDHLRQPGAKETLLKRIVWQESNEELALSVVSIQELYEGQSTRQLEQKKSLLSIIAPLKMLPYSVEVAQKAGELARDLRRPVELADAVIAATAMLSRASLLTLNTKDFSGIAGLRLYEL